MVKYLQQQIQPSMLLLLMGAILMLTGLAGYLYVFKKPLSEYRQAQQTFTLLQDEITTGISLSEQLANTQNSVSQLERQLLGSSPALPINQKIAFVIGRLDSVSVRHKVNLNSVQPGEVAQVFQFQELPFNIEISGSYFSLFAWLQQVEQDLGSIVIKDFAMRSSEAADNSITMKLTLVSYLPMTGDKPW